MNLIIPFATLLAATPASAGFTTYEQSMDLEGVFFLSPKEETIAAFQACLDNASSSSSDEQVECGFYINPHTDYSYRSNPSAIGIYRGQFHFDHTDNEGKHHFVVDSASTKIINDVMIASGLQLQSSGGANSAGMCDSEPYNELDPDAASAVDTEVVWDEGDPDSVDDDTVTIISSRVTLKEDLSTTDIRKTQCSAFNGGDFDDTGIEYFNNLDGVKVGQHIHLGDPTEDGPPAVGFCGPFGPGGIPVCKDVLIQTSSSED